MSRTQCIIVMACIIAHPAVAQGRIVNLTGKPSAAIEAPFTQISGVRELPGNRAVVVDASEKTLQMADFAKGDLTKISRNGGGPGEYQLPINAFAGPNNATYVADPQIGKIHVVTPDGKIPSALLTPGGDGPGGLVVPRGIDARGRVFFQGLGFVPGQAGPSDTVPVIRWDPATKKVDSVAWIPSGVISTASSGGNRTVFTLRTAPYNKADTWGALPDGRVAIVRAEPYRVDIVDGPGRVQRGPVVSYIPIKIGAPERDAYRKQQQSNPGTMLVRGTGGGGAVTGQPRITSSPVSDDDFPPVMPAFPIGGLRITPNGEIWVSRYRAANDKIPTYDIFDSTGKLIGKATLKPNSTIVGFGAGTVYIARQDPEDDLRYLEKYVR